MQIDIPTLENCLLLLYIAEDLYALRHNFKYIPKELLHN